MRDALLASSLAGGIVLVALWIVGLTLKHFGHASRAYRWIMIIIVSLVMIYEFLNYLGR